MQPLMNGDVRGCLSFSVADLVEAIKKISIPIISKPDKLIWINGSKGQFSTRSTYRVSLEHHEVADNEVM